MIGKDERDITQDDAWKLHMSNLENKVYVAVLGRGMANMRDRC